jgi:hypothetical protein
MLNKKHFNIIYRYLKLTVNINYTDYLIKFHYFDYFTKSFVKDKLFYHFKLLYLLKHLFFYIAALFH